MVSDVWPTVRLGHYCLKIGSGATPTGGKESYLYQGPVKLIRSQNVYNHGFNKNGLAFISNAQASKLDGVSVEENDVLLNITGDSVARVCLAPKAALPARVNQHVAIIRPIPEEFDARFLRYFLISPRQQSLLLGLAAAGATRNALTKGMIENLEVTKPGLSEQEAVADVLSILDKKIELNQRMNYTLEGIAQALFKSWFVDFEPVKAKAEGRKPEGIDDATAALFPSTFTDSIPGLIPEGWIEETLERVSFLNPESWSRNNTPAQIEYVDLANTKWGTIESTQIFSWKDAPSRAQRILRKGDTIVGTVRPGNGSYSFISTDGLTGSTGFAVLRPKETFYRESVYLSATSTENIARLTNLADGAAYPAVRPDVVYATSILFPGDEILLRFSQCLSPNYGEGCIKQPRKQNSR
jgi:type I restriction enzyme, S subunit